MTTPLRTPRPELGLCTFCIAAATLLPATAPAQTLPGEADGVRFGVSGYVRTLTGIHDRGFDLPDLAGLPGLPSAAPAPRTSGFHSQVARLKWQVEGASWRLDIHNRFQARLNSAGTDGGPAIGIGVSAVPDRLVDLEATLIDADGLRVWHDVDRLSLSVFTHAADLTIGRQAITWGVSAIFPVADLWAQFSPFELDTEEKPGIDAVRALFYPVDGLEMDAVLAHRGSLDDLSFGLRGTYALPAVDLWAGAGKLWRQAMLMGGGAFLLDQVKLRAELVVPWDLDRDTFQDPRATLGADWIRGTLLLTGEYHFNGIGAGDPGSYPSTLQDPRFGRESYYLGRHYLGAATSWSPDQENRVTLTLNALANLQDPSTALTPMIGYDLGQATRISLGGLLSFGRTPRFTPTPALRSEFGTYGDFLFTRVSVYF